MSNLLDKAKLAAESAGTIISNLAQGKSVSVSEELAAERLKVCSSCPKLGSLLGKPQCQECGCFLTLKSQLEGMKCPLGKWKE